MSGLYSAFSELSTITNLNPMATCLQFSYADLSLLFARFHTKTIPWDHKSQDFVELGFFESDGEEYDGEDEDTGM